VLLLALSQLASSSTNAFGTYFVHRPPNLSHNQSVPLVLACCGKAMEQDSTLDQESDRHGFVVVYLAPSRTYNDVARARGPGPPYPDTQWIGSVIDEVRGAQNADPVRIFMTGTSQGGTLSYRVACDLSSKVAAIASVAGEDVVPGCKPTQPISVMEVHGTADAGIPYNGSPGFLSMPQVIAKWRGIDGCSQQSQVTNVQKAKNEVWSTCKAKTAVELVTVIGGGHGWQKSPTFDTGGAVWRFFAAHPQASSTPTAALTGKLLQARIAYKPTRRVLVRVNVGQASSVQTTLLRIKRTIATRTIRSAEIGVSNVVLRIPRSAKAGTYTLRVAVRAGGAQLVLTHKLQLHR
jgi:polyhydroxybutyrate depolymerase